MKIKLLLTAEFEADPHNYDDYPNNVLEIEQANLDEMGPHMYLTIFEEDEILARLSVVEDD